MMFVYSLLQSLFSWSLRNSNRKGNEYRTNKFIQNSLWSLSIQFCSSLFSWQVRYSNRKSSDVGLIYLNSVLYGVCLFTVAVCYSVGMFVF